MEEGGESEKTLGDVLTTDKPTQSTGKSQKERRLDHMEKRESYIREFTQSPGNRKESSVSPGKTMKLKSSTQGRPKALGEGEGPMGFRGTLKVNL